MFLEGKAAKSEKNIVQNREGSELFNRLQNDSKLRRIGDLPLEISPVCRDNFFLISYGLGTARNGLETSFFT